MTLVIATSDETRVELVQAGDHPAVLDSAGVWRVTVPLRLGFNLLRVQTWDASGNQDPFAASVSIQRETILWIEPRDLCFDPSSGDALVLDPLMRALLRVRADGAREVITGPETGTGEPLEDPRDVDLLAVWGAAVVTDGRRDAVVLVDLATGARTPLSSPTLGGGPTLVDPQGIALDLLRNRALVLDPGRAELLAVDLVTGERSTLSGEAAGSGLSLGSARRMALDSRRNRALVTLESEPAVLAVDLTSGDRTVLSGGAAGSGPAFVAPADLAVDLLRDRAFVTDPGAGAVFEVALASGARQVLSAHTAVGEPDWITPAGIALRADGVPLVLDRSLDALIEVGPSRRRILSGITTGSGPAIGKPAALDGSLLLPEHLVVAEATELLTADVSDGTRKRLSGTDRGTGAPFVQVSAVAVSRGPRACFTVLDAGLPGLISVGRINGERRTISGEGFGIGPDFSAPRCMVLEPSVVECSNAALVADHRPGGPPAILRVDFSSGNRTIVSDATHGTGPDLVDPVAMEVDLRPIDVFLVVLDAGLRAIHSIDLFTGDRTHTPLPTLPGTPTDLVLEGGGYLMTAADPPGLLEVKDESATVLSGGTVGSGPAMGRPAALELVSSPTLGSVPPLAVVYVLDTARGSVLAVDRKTGERVIRTK